MILYGPQWPLGTQVGLCAGSGHGLAREYQGLICTTRPFWFLLQFGHQLGRTCLCFWRSWSLGALSGMGWSTRTYLVDIEVFQFLGDAVMHQINMLMIGFGRFTGLPKVPKPRINIESNWEWCSVYPWFGNVKIAVVTPQPILEHRSVSCLLKFTIRRPYKFACLSTSTRG